MNELAWVKPEMDTETFEAAMDCACACGGGAGAGAGQAGDN